MIRKHLSKDHRKKIGISNIGKHHTEKTKKKMSDRKRTPFKEILKFVENTDYILLTTKEEYESRLLKLKFRCPNKHEFEMRLDKFKSGTKCKECQKIPFEKIEKYFKNKGYILLSKKGDYKDCNSKLKTICPKGHKYEVTWNGFKYNDNRCLKCFRKRQKTTFQEIEEYVKNTGYTLLLKEEEFKNCYSKIKLICLEGHVYETRWDIFKAGFRCRKCYNERLKGKHLSQETRKKMRIATIKRIESRHGQCYPNYNPEACKLIDEYGKENNYNFQHAENGGEFLVKGLGYWVDGYDKKRNTIIEIDEAHHFDINGNLSERDIQRQKEITEFLKCEFIRFRI